jgi:ADP-ribosyl-[dinitrogen reductase] hydrolase
MTLEAPIGRATPTTAVRRDRAVGVVVASAAADGLGAPHEFGPALADDVELTMTGGGSFSWAPGEWTDDTQQALAVLLPLAEGGDGDRLDAIAGRLRAWFDSGPNDVGNQTRAVFSIARRNGGDLTAAAAEYQAGRPDDAGNGSLMRTGPVGLIGNGDPEAVVRTAAAVSAFTHPHPDAVDACVLWSTAIARAMELPTGSPPDWVALVADGLTHLDPQRRPVWEERLEACRTTPPGEFTPNGWVVAALQAALASIAQTTPPPDQPPCTHLRLAIERAVRLGGDTDTVAAIAGSLLGAYWGATAVPQHWRRKLHGRVTYIRDEPAVRLADLDRASRLAANNGQPDQHGWPGIESLLPHYEKTWPAAARGIELTDGIIVGNVHAVPQQVEQVGAVVSLCRMGSTDVPDGVEHHVIGLLDTKVEENPNLDFVLADTVDLVAGLHAEGKRVFVHCVQAENRTPAVAAAYLVRHQGMAPSAALDQVETVLGRRPKSFLAEAVLRLGT